MCPAKENLYSKRTENNAPFEFMCKRQFLGTPSKILLVI